MELNHIAESENTQQRMNILLAEKDARIAELTLALEHERKQVANVTQALIALASCPEVVGSKKPRHFFSKWINPGSLIENWVANLLAGGTWPVVILAVTPIYAIVSHLNWSLPEKLSTLPGLINSVVYVIMNILTWRGAKTRYAKEWDQAYYIVVRAVGSVTVLCIGDQALNYIGWFSAWYWLTLIVGAFFGLAIIKKWPLHEWGDKFYGRDFPVTE